MSCLDPSRHSLPFAPRRYDAQVRRQESGPQASAGGKRAGYFNVGWGPASPGTTNRISQ